MGFLSDFVPMLMPQYWRKDEPVSHAPIKYEPEFGFEDRPRPLKVVRSTLEEMNSANLEEEARDFCSHLTIEWRGCLHTNAPFWYKCKGLQAELKNCYFEEKIHDMKEFERERRLNVRERLLQEKSK